MKKVLFLTNYPAPYRVRFFDELARTLDVTVLFADRTEDQKHRNADWYIPGQGRFHAVQLERRAAVFGTNALCLDVTAWLRKDFDAIVVCGYSNPTVMLAMAYLRLHRIPFYMEVDGGLIRREGRGKYLFKRALVRMASWWLSSGRATTRYLVHYGAEENRVFTYPFSSLDEGDIADAPAALEEMAALRQMLGSGEAKVVLAVGQFIHRMGFDVLLRAVPDLEPDTGVYFVGGTPTADYLRLREELGAERVHFVGFLKKEALTAYYRAADVFVLPTREDIWGLVVNEAMAYGLPVIATDHCVAALELVEDGVSGYLVPVEDAGLLAERINRTLAGDTEKMGAAALERVRPYTIQGMVRAHLELFERGDPSCTSSTQ